MGAAGQVMASVSAKLNEPSMEEILASIRRIIADDQETLQIVQGPAPTGAGSPLRTVLDLTEQQVLSEILPEAVEPEAAAVTAFDDPDPVEAEPPGPLSPNASSRIPDGPAPTIPVEAPLLSRETETSLVGAFTRLDSTVAQSAPKTLEDLAREMLRPMLKTWLDDNLAPMVERLVQAEIERVARTRR
jgi:cell pole-organizing protein PopZ